MSPAWRGCGSPQTTQTRGCGAEGWLHFCVVVFSGSGVGGPGCAPRAGPRPRPAACAGVTRQAAGRAADPASPVSPVLAGNAALPGAGPPRAGGLPYRKLSSYNCGMRRRAGDLLPIEQAILAGGIELAAAGEPGFYGFAMARQIRDASAARQLTAHGTLYKALARLEQAGLLTSSWEDPGPAEAERRPRRRLYRVTPSGEQAVLRSTGQRAGTAPRPGLGLSPA